MPIPKKEDLEKEVPEEEAKVVQFNDYDRKIDDTKKDRDKYLTKKQKMAQLLEEQPKIRFMIPLEGKEKPGVVRVKKGKTGINEYEHVSGAVTPVTINGYKMLYPKGVYIDMPQQVVDILSASQVETLKAGEHWLVDRDEEVIKALS